MNNMLTRAISGTVFIAILISSILYSPYTFWSLFYLLMLISIYEFSRMLKFKGLEIYFVSSALFFGTIAPHWNIPSFYAYALSLIGIIFTLGKELFLKDNENAIKRFSNFLLVLFYISISYIFITKIPFTNTTAQFDGKIMLGVFILIWANDTFAYLTGISIGKTKLLERISPKKTIEGFVGGMLATIAFAYFLAEKLHVLHTLHWINIGIIVSIFGVAGDLVASLFKRQTGVKDTGKIIPGHGGVIDRLDSIIFVAPLIYLYLKFIMYYVS